jgi:PhzF family phenazine biosynthesis protein
VQPTAEATLRRLRFHLVNVFALPGDPFSGNPLCVFEDGVSLSSGEMQALARQTNLSETTFLLPPRDGGSARARIFTPTGEMPFAGHPTLGTSHVVAATARTPPETVILELPAGNVRVERRNDTWTLDAPRAPRTRIPEATAQELAEMVGAAGLGGAPLWVDTGVEQLVVPLASIDDVRNARPSPSLLDRLAVKTEGDKRSVYVWAQRPDGSVLARYFFLQHGGVTEDPATGSACANLGGWLAASRRHPARLEVDQGEAVARPSRLSLTVDAGGRIRVGGLVSAIGSGEMVLPEG